MFHPVVQSWFKERVGEPTEVQARAWPRIAAGEHVLAIAPTGSGKTLAAFLWAIDCLLSGAWSGGRVRVLYVSPLRALGNDVRRNLLTPLAELRARFEAAALPAPEIQVATRTGDTPADERRRMVRRPPEILITTPETLNILLTSRGGRALLSGIGAVVLDEVHAVAATKRGAQLITGIERLASVAGEFQRIALSATVTPAERVAEWVGGFLPGSGERGARRPVAIVRSRVPKRYDLSVGFPDSSGDRDSFWNAVAADIRRSLERNRSTLVFANSKRSVEKLTRLLNRDAPEEVVYSHHGALSREVRAVVEERLKRGELRGIVATNSLELGIDIGSLDEVVLAQTPPSLASAAQRIGRAGHSVGGVSRARFVPFAGRDLLQAAVVARAVLEGQLEPLRPIAAPLDVLAQAVVSMVASEPWPIDRLFATLRCSDPFHELPRRLFDLVLEMLAGRFASARLRHLRPLLSVDRVDGTVRGLPGSERLVYQSGGTILDRGYFHLRRDGSGALLGELDEEFVWERRVGDAFTLGVQSWKVERITHNDVFVVPAPEGAPMAPFWRAEARDRGFELSERVGEFLEAADGRLGDPAFLSALETENRLDPGAARALVRYLAEERAALGGFLPHRRRLVAECVVDPSGSARDQLVLHTFWGGRVNRPLALALSAAWEERFGEPLETTHDDDCIALGSSRAIDPGALLALARSETVEPLLTQRLEGSGFFGAKFREAAGIALLLPREGFRKRTPLWLARQRAKELLDAVGKWNDFPLRLEAWRACLADAFDLAALRRVLDEVRDGRIEVRVATTDRPSPFAAGVVWRRTNELMYEDDAQAPGRKGGPRADLLREVVFAAHLRPRIAARLAESFQHKAQRVWSGYAPASPEDLLDWLVERVVLPRAEWSELLAAVERDHAVPPAALVERLAGKIAALRLPGGAAREVVAAVQALPRVLRALGTTPDAASLYSATLDGSPDHAARLALERLWNAEALATEDAAEGADPRAELLAELLRFYGPLDPAFALSLLGLAREEGEGILAELADSQRIVVDELTDSAPGPQVCDAENLEILLRLARSGARPEFAAVSIDRLPAFLADWQGAGGAASGVEGVRGALERLFGFSAPAESWEADILPARIPDYLPAWLDALLAETELAWLGCGEKRITFALAGERELFVAAAAAPAPEGASEGTNAVFPPGPGRFAFEELLAHSGLASSELSRRLWEQVWNGAASNDGFAALRKGLQSGFAPAESAPARGAASRPRLRFDRWKATRPFAGSWYRLAPPAGEGDAIDREERDKDRARVLLERYGIVFRELLEREAPPFRWRDLFRALRLMELSGEVVAGEFFSGVRGLQFAAPAAFERLRDGGAGERVFWVSAIDPASPCGLGVEGLTDRLPRRVAGSHVVFHGARLVVVSERRGRRLEIEPAPDHPRLPDYLAFLKNMLGRAVEPAGSVIVESINGEAAAGSPYREPLARLFQTERDLGTLRLSRRY